MNGKKLSFSVFKLGFCIFKYSYGIIRKLSFGSNAQNKPKHSAKFINYVLQFVTQAIPRRTESLPLPGPTVWTTPQSTKTTWPSLPRLRDRKTSWPGRPSQTFSADTNNLGKPATRLNYPHKDSKLALLGRYYFCVPIYPPLRTPLNARTMCEIYIHAILRVDLNLCFSLLFYAVIENVCGLRHGYANAMKGDGELITTLFERMRGEKSENTEQHLSAFDGWQDVLTRGRQTQTGNLWEFWNKCKFRKYLLKFCKFEKKCSGRWNQY